MARLLAALRRVAEHIRRHGMGTTVARLFDRVLARGLGVHFARVYLLEASRPGLDVSTDFDSRWMSDAELAAAALDRKLEIEPAMLTEADHGESRCLGIWVQGKLAAYGWFKTNCVPPEHCLGAGIELPADCAYHFKAFTHPAFRGRRLHALVLAAGSARLAAEGIRAVLVVVERSNRASHRSTRHAGCRELGSLSVWGTAARYGVQFPPAAGELGIRFTPGMTGPAKSSSLA